MDEKEHSIRRTYLASASPVGEAGGVGIGGAGVTAGSADIGMTTGGAGMTAGGAGIGVTTGGAGMTAGGAGIGAAEVTSSLAGDGSSMSKVAGEGGWITSDGHGDTFASLGEGAVEEGVTSALAFFSAGSEDPLG